MGIQFGPFLGPDPHGPKCFFLIKQKIPKLHISVGVPFLHVYPIFWGPYHERSRRVSMNAFNFSTDDILFCQFMNQNVPKPMFLGPMPVGALTFYVSENTYYIPNRAHPGPRWTAHAWPTQGPWRPKADQMGVWGRSRQKKYILFFGLRDRWQAKWDHWGTFRLHLGFM